MNDKDKSELAKYAILGIGGYLFFQYVTNQFKSGVSNLFGNENTTDTVPIKKELLSINSPFSPNFYKSAPVGSLLLTRLTADNFSKQILDSVGFFKDDFALVLGVFRQLKTQSQVSFLSDRFLAISGYDLLTWLLGDTWPDDRFNSEQVNQILTIVKQLPKYK